jgi:hypothetical protein
VLGFCLLLSATAASAQQVPSRAAVTQALSGFEEQPDVATVRAWGAAAVSVLAAVIDDEDAIIGVRARAAYALRAFVGDLAARAVLQRVAADTRANLFVRRAAIDALIDGGDDVATVSAQLGAADPEVRTGAVIALGRSRQRTAARAALDARSRAETDPSIRQRVAESLRRLSTR